MNSWVDLFPDHVCSRNLCFHTLDFIFVFESVSFTPYKKAFSPFCKKSEGIFVAARFADVEDTAVIFILFFSLVSVKPQCHIIHF